MEGEKEGGIDITPKEFGVRTLTQEYGGGAFRVSSSHDQLVVFSNYKDQRLYKQHFANKDSSPSQSPLIMVHLLLLMLMVSLIPALTASLLLGKDGRLDRSNPLPPLWEVNLSGGDTLEEPKVLVSGNDFYAFPRLDPKCERLAWIQWTLPNMPWDKAQLWVGYISESELLNKRVFVLLVVDPEYVEVSTEPKWSPKSFRLKRASEVS
ncbi:alpha/beta-Hydrolases superfamily protein [Raphanus sativus]|nr:alpha/beta-Hydrolases superfamily protein [Raphanus sativus]